ncbi:MAG TPA: phosphatase [Acidimicrobiia bacterium]|nr:phosphatase [Acidimicrobiia bacterium]
MSPRPRPPRLEPHIPEPQAPASPPTLEQRLERAKVAGAGVGPGPTELRRFIERVVAGDPGALGELPEFSGLTAVEAWAAFDAVFGITPEQPTIDAHRTVDAARRAVAQIEEVGRGGGRIAVATASPASVLPLAQAFARLARGAGGELEVLPDAGPIRVDGRSGRALRWVDGVASVTDGQGLLATRDGEAAREWFFVLRRPSLVVADGPFAEVAWAMGVPVVALAPPERGALAIAAARADRCLVVPVRMDREPRCYGPLSEALEAWKKQTLAGEL